MAVKFNAAFIIMQKLIALICGVLIGADQKNELRKEMEEKFVQGSTKAKLIFFAVLCLGLIWLWLNNPFNGFLTILNQGFVEIDSLASLKQLLEKGMLLVIASSLIYWTMALYFMWLALKAKKSGRWPPPNMLVPFRIRIRRGRYVKILWITLIIAASVFFLKPIFDLYAWVKIYQLSVEIDVSNQR